MNLEKKERIQYFLRAFLPTLTNAHQYTISHQLTISSIETSHTQLLEAIGSDLTLLMKIVEDRVVIDEEPLEDSIYVNRFIQFFRNKNIQYIRFSHGTSREEFASFIAMLTAGPAFSEETQIFPHIQFGKVGLGFKTDEEEQNETDETEKWTDEEGESSSELEESWKIAQVKQYFANIQEKDLDLMENVYDAVKKNQSLPDGDIRDAVTDIINAIKQGSSVLIAFSPLRELDEYTFTHSTNVCILTLAQAMALKIKEDLLHDIGIAAMLHDVGKMFVPEEILNKQGKLTDDEFEQIKSHSQKGAEYLIDKPGIPPLAIVAAYEHHMQYNFSGYPNVSSNWRQNICSQMTTISDYFDACRTKRIYRDSIETKIIVDQMTNAAGVTLNPVLTKNFLFLIKKLLEAQQS
jgi:HD-GYP domain-containing protein (c-di-GMP phosphodiesterase class II)